jgi:hypothetical protein
VTAVEPKRKPFYLRWWFIVIVVVLVIGLIGSLKPPAKDPDTSAPPTAANTNPAPSAMASDAPPSAPSEGEVVRYIAARLEQPTLQDACTIDGIGWACNITKVEPLNDTEMRVTVTQLADNVQGVGVALAFRNFASTAPDAPMPNLVRVVVVNSAGEELGRVDN